MLSLSMFICSERFLIFQMEFSGETRSVNQPGTDAERFNTAETTDPESSATVNPQQPITGPAEEAQQAVGVGAVATQHGPSNIVHETHATVTQQSAGRRGTVGLPAGQQPELPVAVRPNPSQRAQPAIPTIEPGLPVQEVGGFVGYLVEPEEPEHPQQPLQDYIIVFASQPSKFIICSYATETIFKLLNLDALIVSVLISGSST